MLRRAIPTKRHYCRHITISVGRWPAISRRLTVLGNMVCRCSRSSSSINRICTMNGPPPPDRLRNAPFPANMDYQALLAGLLVVFILAAVFLILSYTPHPPKTSKSNYSVQFAKWLRLAGAVRPSERNIQISSLTGPGLWPFIRRTQPMP